MDRGASRRHNRDPLVEHASGAVSSAFANIFTGAFADAAPGVKPGPLQNRWQPDEPKAPATPRTIIKQGAEIPAQLFVEISVSQRVGEDLPAIQTSQ